MGLACCAMGARCVGIAMNVQHITVVHLTADSRCAVSPRPKVLAALKQQAHLLTKYEIMQHSASAASAVLPLSRSTAKVVISRPPSASLRPTAPR